MCSPLHCPFWLVTWWQRQDRKTCQWLLLSSFLLRTRKKKKHTELLILLSPPRVVRPTATLFVLIRDFSMFRCFIRGSNLLLVACKAHFNICHEFPRNQWRFSRRSIAVPSSTSTCSKSTWCWRRSGWQLEDLEAKMGQLLHNNRSSRPTGRLQVCYASS